ncbi:MAG TPA: hypothetical protein EYN66_06455 [Myxococcales bacterium]|nr:hypothetical protein [Myxococcales bacterium]
MMQIMIGSLEEPTGDITAEGSDRIWFHTKMRDVSGCAEVGVPERIALDLTGLDREGFKEAHATGAVQFPLLCNFRVSRSVSAGWGRGSQNTSSQTSDSHTRASQPDVPGAKIYVNSVVQEADAVDWDATVAPNAAYESILAILNILPRHDGGILFGYLKDIAPDPHCGFKLVFDNGNTSKGAAVAVLIAVNKKSKPPEPLGQGYKIVTANVCDVANPSSGAASQNAVTATTNEIIGYCTLEDMSKFDLAPPRGQPQRYAIALITKCEEIPDANANSPHMKSFLLDKLQILEQAEGCKAIPVFQRLRRLAMRLTSAHTDVQKHTLDIVEDKSQPTKKCKRLCSVPTDTSLGEQGV